MFDENEAPRFYKIADLPKGCIIWNKEEILGITGITLPEEYNDCLAIKTSGNKFDYELLKR